MEFSSVVHLPDLVAASGWLQAAETARVLAACRWDQYIASQIRQMLDTYGYEALAAEFVRQEQGDLHHLVGLVEEHEFGDLPVDEAEHSTAIQGIDRSHHGDEQTRHK